MPIPTFPLLLIRIRSACAFPCQCVSNAISSLLDASRWNAIAAPPEEFRVYAPPPDKAYRRLLVDTSVVKRIFPSRCNRSTGPITPIPILPVKLGLANGAFVAILFVIVVLKLASSPNAAANSFNVSNVLGALSTKPAKAVEI